jgi:hypothetical protein
MVWKEFIRELNGNRVEGELVKTIFYSLLTSIVFLGVIYFLLRNQIPDFIDRFGFFLFFSALSYAVTLPAVRQVRAYKELGCMAGMMIGMMIGAAAGFLAGFAIGATNGMFIGGVFGMAVGIFLGVWNGNCCGVMGVMEGIMAGFMGGLMGAMISVMTLNDYLRIMAGVVFIVCAIMLLGLNYMVYKEMRESGRQRKEDHFFTVVLTFALIALTTAIMIFGPRSGLFV